MWLMNTGSRLLVMEEGKPCKQTMPSKNARAIDAAQVWVTKGDEVRVLGEPVDDGEDD
jgi:hypothetical protein